MGHWFGAAGGLDRGLGLGLSVTQKWVGVWLWTGERVLMIRFESRPVQNPHELMVTVVVMFMPGDHMVKT